MALPHILFAMPQSPTCLCFISLFIAPSDHMDIHNTIQSNKKSKLIKKSKIE